MEEGDGSRRGKVGGGGREEEGEGRGRGEEGEGREGEERRKRGGRERRGRRRERGGKEEGEERWERKEEVCGYPSWDEALKTTSLVFPRTVGLSAPPPSEVYFMVWSKMNSMVHPRQRQWSEPSGGTGVRGEGW